MDVNDGSPLLRDMIYFPSQDSTTRSQRPRPIILTDALQKVAVATPTHVFISDLNGSASYEAQNLGLIVLNETQVAYFDSLENPGFLVVVNMSDPSQISQIPTRTPFTRNNLHHPQLTSQWLELYSKTASSLAPPPSATSSTRWPSTDRS